MEYLTGLKAKGRSSPKHVGSNRKFNSNGSAQSYTGCTVLCNIHRRASESGDFASTISDVQRRLQAQDFAQYFTYLPLSSLHMTVAPLVTQVDVPNKVEAREDKPRGVWPEDINGELPMEEVAAQLCTRFSKVRAVPDIYMKPTSLRAGYSLRLEPANEESENALLALRRDIYDKLHVPRHDEKQSFHITLAYNVQWMDEATARRVQELSDELFKALAPYSQIRFPVVEFCSFDSMTSYTTKSTLPLES